MRLGGICVSVFVGAALLLTLGGAGDAHSASISNWDKGARSWNDSHMTKIKTAMQDSGRPVNPDGPITSTNLDGAAVFVIGEPSATPTTTELAVLKQFVIGGGMVLIFGDTGIDIPTYNNLLAGIGSTMSYTPTTIATTSALADGLFTLSPWKISGSTLSVTSGNGTSGGTLVDNNYVRYEHIGAGYVVVMGDRIDHNSVISDTNTRLMLNLVSAAAALAQEPPLPAPAVQVPAMSGPTLLLLALLLAGAGAMHHRRRRI